MYLPSFDGCSSTWEEISDCVTSPVKCQSVGWLIYDDAQCKVIVPHLSQANHPNVKEQGCGDMTIPASAILNIKDLIIAKPKRGVKKNES